MRTLVSALASLLGSAVVLGLLVWVNQRETPPPETERVSSMAFDVAAPPPPPPPPQPRPRPRRQSARADVPAVPVLGAGLGGLDLGLGGGGLGLAVADALADAPTDVVMTANTVDTPPRAVEQASPQYPARARARGVEGQVTVSLLIDATGRVADARVTDSVPAGTFDEAALSAVRQWRFTPAEYEGRPVSMRASQVLEFALR